MTHVKPKLLPALALALMVITTPTGPGAWAQSQPSPPTATSPHASPVLTIGLVVGGAILGRFLAQRYLSDWRLVQWLGWRAGASLGAEAAGLAAAL